MAHRRVPIPLRYFGSPPTLLLLVASCFIYRFIRDVLQHAGQTGNFDFADEIGIALSACCLRIRFFVFVVLFETVVKFKRD